MHLSYLAAFLGGVISLLTPCSAMVIPLFASALTQKKANPLRVIGLFTFGLTISLLPLVVGATIFNRLFFSYRESISNIIGVIFLIFGISTLFGFHLQFPSVTENRYFQKHLKHFGFTFSLGFIAGLGSTACIGPILGAIISFGLVSSSPLSSTFYMILYIAGIMLPLLGFTSLFVKYQENKLVFFYQRSIKLRGKSIPISQLFTAFLLIGVAYMFLFHQGSIAAIPQISNSELFDRMLDFQDALLTN
jgi:cytochrome c biogenesis protein CcdA